MKHLTAQNPALMLCLAFQVAGCQFLVDLDKSRLPRPDGDETDSAGDGDGVSDETGMDPGEEDGETDSIDAVDGDSAGDEYECLLHSDCSDGNPCNGIETCDPELHACISGTPPDEGTVCSTGELRMICLDTYCVESVCGDDYVDLGGDEFCEPPGVDQCRIDCTLGCTGPEHCLDDGEACNGEEFCNLEELACERRNAPAEGMVCSLDPRRICVGEVCSESRCGDGYVDAEDGEECEDGNDVPGDGCEPVTCLYSCREAEDCNDGHDCTLDLCDNDSHQCDNALMSFGVLCRPAAGQCDVSESCDGENPGCPANVLRPNGFDCDDGDPCTEADKCDGAGNCGGWFDGPPFLMNVSAGGQHTCALSTSRVLCWGHNDNGQLGDGTWTGSTTLVEVTGIFMGGHEPPATGGWHTCFITSSDRLKCWGRNNNGQLGNGTTTNSNVPVNVSVLSDDIELFDAGWAHTCALKRGMGPDSLYCWGANDSGQLGNDSTIDALSPVTVNGSFDNTRSICCGTGHSCAVTESGGVKCWGRNAHGQLGDGTTTNRHTPVDVTDLASGAVKVVCGDGHTCALTQAGAAKCWGWNMSGQLGDGTTTDSAEPVDVAGLGGNATDIACGLSHSCVSLEGGTLKCWGWNSDGQLGDGTTTDRETPVAVMGLMGGSMSVSARGNHTCTVNFAYPGHVTCWGDNQNGQLGNGTVTNSSSPVELACEE